MAELTIKDIADLTGVSYATVSRTLNNRSGVSPATREKILETANALGYKPNIHARSLKTNQSLIIALIVPDIANPFFADIACAVSETAFSKGYNTILCSTNWDPEIEKAQLKLVQEQRVDGIIFKSSDRTHERYNNINIPKVMIANLPHAEGLSYIEVDNLRGGKLAAQHLWGCGYRRPAFLGGSRDSLSNADRFSSFASALKALGSPLSENRVCYGPFTIENGYRLAKELLTQTAAEKPDCFFCGNDLIALGAMQYLIETGIKIPEEFGLIGFDDIYLSSLPQIQLTTLSQPRSQMGQMAADVLIQHIELGKKSHEEHILLEPALIVRKSTRPFRS